MNVVYLNHGQVPRPTPELHLSLNFHTKPTGGLSVSTDLPRIRSCKWRVFSGTTTRARVSATPAPTMTTQLLWPLVIL
ncbi:hypothetical protein TNCV_1317061 [Trichonephila clavipes]|nr:hypothetical protein TNCV_1317061 [Trichonephila clavipes]